MGRSVPGHFFQRSGRWYWRGRLPGEQRHKTRRLVQPGQKYATRDFEAAVAIVRRLIRESQIVGADPHPEYTAALTVAGLVKWYRQWAATYYPNGIQSNTTYALNTLVDVAGGLPAVEFGAVALDSVRQAMVDAELCRRIVNQRVAQIRLAFRRAEAAGLVSRGTWEHLSSLEPLRRGHTKAPESPEIMPVPEATVEAVIPYASKVVGAMLRLQLLTGMRPTEVCIMRPCDIQEIEGERVWAYLPSRHKTENAGRRKVVLLGHKCQAVLAPFLKDRPANYFLFKPSEAMADHFVHLRKYNSGYSAKTYHHAVQHACAAARKAGVQVDNFAPYRIRHAVATRLDGILGAEAAAEVLGHTSTSTTLRHYIKRSLSRAMESAKRFG